MTQIQRTLVAAIVTATILAAAGSAHAGSGGHSIAACRRWDIAGVWTSGQSNEHDLVTYRFRQDGSRLSGSGTLSATDAAIAGYRSGTLSGRIRGDHVRFLVVWQRSSQDGLVHRGLYTAVVSRRHMTGQTRDLTVEDQADFSARGSTRCVS